jgi:uncharacterized membrane protein YccC
MYWFAHDMGAAGPTPPLRREVQRRIATEPAMATAMIRLLNHELRPSKAFNPAFSLSTLAQALRHGRGHRGAIAREAAAAALDELRQRRIARRLTYPLV